METQSQSFDLIPTANGTDGREALPKFWIAAYTWPRSEKKAACELAKLGVENYVPIQSLVKQWSDRKKKIDVVVIPNIIFIHSSENDIEIIKRHPLIIKILCYPGQKSYSAIPDGQIDSLKYMLNSNDQPVTFMSTGFKVNQSVRVKRGHLQGLIGGVEKITQNKSKLILSIDILGGAMIEIDSSDLEILDLASKG